MNMCHKGTDWNREYSSIANAAVNYSFSHVPLFDGDLNNDGIDDKEDIIIGQYYTAAMFISMAYHESGFIGKNNRGSNGADVCLMQINSGNVFRITSGWTANEIEADYEKCFDLGYKSLRYSFKRGGNLTSRLMDYTSHRRRLALTRCRTFTVVTGLSFNKWCN